MLVCCLRLCPKDLEQKELYGLPSHYPSKQSWLAKIRDKIDAASVESNRNQLRICHFHFKPTDFVLNITDHKFTKQLKETACPSVFPEDDEWRSNYIAHQQLNQANSAHSNNASTPMEVDVSHVEDIVELGNVESLGIFPEAPHPHCSQNLDFSENKTQVASSSQANATIQATPSSPIKPFCSPDAKSSPFSRRLGNSPSLTSRLQYSCGDCDFRTTDVILLRDHKQKRQCSRKNVYATQPQPLQTISSSDDEIEHVCTTCGFTTAILRLLIDHQKTHNTEGSSTEELSEEDFNEMNAFNPKFNVKVDKEAISETNTDVYCCPECDFWTRHIPALHKHLVVEHKKQKMFKCSQCDFKSSKRRSVTKHIERIQESANKDHDGASWTIVTDFEPSKTCENPREERKPSSDAGTSGSTGSASITVNAVNEHQPLTTEESGSATVSVKNEGIEQHSSTYIHKGVLSVVETSNRTSEVKIEVMSVDDPAEESAGELSLTEKMSFNELAQQCRLNRAAVSKLENVIKAKKEEMDELFASQKRNSLEEKSLIERRDEIRKASSSRLKEKLQTEMKVRMHQCEILKSKLALIHATTSREEAEGARRAISDLEDASQQLEAQLRSCEKDICELEREENTCAEQLVKLTESNATIEKMIQAAQSELGEEEPRYIALVKEQAVLQKKMRRAISEERSRIKMISTIRKVRAERNFKRFLLLLRKKEQKRLMRLDKLMDNLEVMSG